MTPQAALAEIRRQLAWRGPTGRPQGHIVLSREAAEAVAAVLSERGHQQ